MEIKYFEKGFYIVGIHNNIPTQAQTITKEYHQELLLGLSNGKELSENETGYPILIDKQIDIVAWQEEMINNINYQFIIETEHTPITYEKNGLQYYSEYSVLYSNILPKFVDDTQTLRIWDITDKIENTVYMNKPELLELALFLAGHYEKSFQVRKEKIANVKSCSKPQEFEG